MATRFDPFLGRIRKKDEGDGAPGPSAYDVAVANGFVGTEAQWLASLEGDQGIQGLKGDKGDTGDVGPAGTTSWTGITDKPSTFTPSPHAHPISDVTDLQTALDSKISNLSLDGLTDVTINPGGLAEQQALRWNGVTWTEGNPGVMQGDSLGNGLPVYDSLSGDTINFKTLLAGTNVTITDTGTGELEIAASGGGTSPDTFVVLASDATNSTLTPAAVSGLATTVAAGTYLVKYWIVYRAAATTTGIEMYMQHTGTTSRLASTWYTLTTGGAAATGVGDQATTATAQMIEGKGQRASNVASGTTQGVDTANADQFAVMEGLMVVTASGTLNLMYRSEVSGSAVSIMSGTTLVLTKVA